MIAELFRVAPSVLEKLRREPETVVDVLFDDESPIEDDQRLDLDTTWHGLHFLLTGTADLGGSPLDFLAQSEPLGDDEESDAQFVPAPLVAQIAALLSKLDRETLSKRFDPAKMMKLEIFPESWSEPDARDVLLDYAEQLVAFVAEAAKRGEALLVVMS